MSNSLKSKKKKQQSTVESISVESFQFDRKASKVYNYQPSKLKDFNAVKSGIRNQYNDKSKGQTDTQALVVDSAIPKEFKLSQKTKDYNTIVSHLQSHHQTLKSKLDNFFGKSSKVKGAQRGDNQAIVKGDLKEFKDTLRDILAYLPDCGDKLTVSSGWIWKSKSQNITGEEDAAALVANIESSFTNCFSRLSTIASDYARIINASSVNTDELTGIKDAQDGKQQTQATGQQSPSTSTGLGLYGGGSKRMRKKRTHKKLKTRKTKTKKTKK